MRSLTQGHPKRKSGLLRPRRNVNYAAMCLSDFGGDVQTKPQPLLAWLHFAPKEWLEKPLHGLRPDRPTAIGDRHFELAAGGRSLYTHGLFRLAVNEAVGEQV
jgi:hypothetical protein